MDTSGIITAQILHVFRTVMFHQHPEKAAWDSRSHTPLRGSSCFSSSASISASHSLVFLHCALPLNGLWRHWAMASVGPRPHSSGRRKMVGAARDKRQRRSGGSGTRGAVGFVAHHADPHLHPGARWTSAAAPRAFGATGSRAAGPSSLKPTGYTWSYSACRIGHSVPIWQPMIGSPFLRVCTLCDLRRTGHVQ
jgi:hypothetical protein